jgi:hypothetical protein
MLLCRHRHQDGAISRHKGTLKTKPLTGKGYDGPAAFYVDLAVFQRCDLPFRPGEEIPLAGWCEVARESGVGVLEPLTPAQRTILERLAEMDL